MGRLQPVLKGVLRKCESPLPREVREHAAITGVQNICCSRRSKLATSMKHRGAHRGHRGHRGHRLTRSHTRPDTWPLPKLTPGRGNQVCRGCSAAMQVLKHYNSYLFTHVVTKVFSFKTRLFPNGLLLFRSVTLSWFNTLLVSAALASHHGNIWLKLLLIVNTSEAFLQDTDTHFSLAHTDATWTGVYLSVMTEFIASLYWASTIIWLCMVAVGGNWILPLMHGFSSLTTSAADTGNNSYTCGSLKIFHLL